MEWYTQHNIT